MDSQNLACFRSNSITANGGGGGDGVNGYWDLWKTTTANVTAGGQTYAASPPSRPESPALKTSSSADHIMTAAADFNMGGFSLSPIDFDPLPSLFTFGPCATSYKDFSYKEKPTHDLADVLLSLKHAVVHPGQMGPLPPLSPLGNFNATYGASSGGSTAAATSSASAHHHHHQMTPASVSFSVHQPAQVVPPAGHHHLHHHHHHLHGYPGQTNANQTAPLSQCGPTNQYDAAPHMVGSLLSPTNQSSNATNPANPVSGGPQQPGNLFPSMSVNVSMNMTMEMPGMAGGAGGTGSSVSPFAAMMAEHHLAHQQQQHPFHHHNNAGSYAATHSVGHPQQLQWSPAAGSLASGAATLPGYSSSTSGSVANSCNSQGHQNLMHVPLHMTYNAGAQHHHHHGYGGQYSFTAEFRPSGESTPLQNGFGSDKSPVCSMRLTAPPPPPAPYKSTAVAKGASGLHAFGPVGIKKRAGPPASCKGAFGYGGAGAHDTQLHAILHGGDVADPASAALRSKVNLCRICGKTYARPSTLKTHMRTHSGEKPYRCATCNKSFSQAANLTAHVRTHSGEKPFRCPICARRFSQSSSVTTHMRTHSGERPYRCRMCKKAFSDSSTLTKHLRIHSGEKPYQCKLCLLRFSQSGNLNRHMRVHVNPI